MSKKGELEAPLKGWRYSCNCGFSTNRVGQAVTHLNANRGHQLSRTEL